MFTDNKVEADELPSDALPADSDPPRGQAHAT